MAENIQDIARRMIEGLWYLEEWHAAGEVLGPPEAVGRTIFLDGTVSLLMHTETNQRGTHRYGMGRFVIEGDRMRYGYDQLFDFVRDGENYRGTPHARAGRLQPYQLTMEGGRLVCRSETLRSRLEFGPERLETYDGEKLVRVWRRRNQAA